MPIPDPPTVALCSFLVCAEAPATSRTAPVEKIVSPRASFGSRQSIWWTEAVSTKPDFSPPESSDLPKSTDKVAGMLRAAQAYEPGWDGYNAPKLDKYAVDEAIAFIDALPTYVSPPQLELHSGGFPIFVFENGETELTVEFHPEQQIIWYGKHDGLDVEGEGPFGSDQVLNDVTTMIAPPEAIAA